MKYALLNMVRENLDDLPRYELPQGYSLRWYRPGDEESWLRIHVEADKYGTFTPASFDEQFGENPGSLPQRQCYLCDGQGHPIGTATAWFIDYQGRPHGRVHWVAILSAFQGRGLAKPLLAGVCTRLKDLGHDRAFLTTNTPRIPAIRLYLKFGFTPVIATDADAAAWRDVGERIPEEMPLLDPPAGQPRGGM